MIIHTSALRGDVAAAVAIAETAPDEFKQATFSMILRELLDNEYIDDNT
jgi:hypothetical protein